MARVERASEGQVFQYDSYRGAKTIRESVTIKSFCGCKVGNWYCITHDRIFQNSLVKDIHILKGHHVLCWICLEHGAEVPPKEDLWPSKV